jgi:hypothetical protein
VSFSQLTQFNTMDSQDRIIPTLDISSVISGCMGRAEHMHCADCGTRLRDNRADCGSLLQIQQWPTMTTER